MHIGPALATAGLVLLRPRCPCCAAVVRDDVFCTGCARQLAGPAGPRCPLCAVEDTDGEVCAACLEHAPAFSSTVAAGRYAHPLDRLIMRFKYGRDLSLAAPLSNLLADALDACAPPDLLLPVPLTPGRLRARGFNQALELCRPLARRLGLPLRADVLRRERDAAAQATLPLEARARNVRGAFRAADVGDLDVAVVDDVMTSGATLREIATCLRAADARRVRCWVLARTPPARSGQLRLSACP